MRLRALLFLMCSLAGVALAQSAPWTFSVRFAEGGEVRVERSDWRIGSADASAAVAVRAWAGGWTPSAQLRVRSALGATVLGNAILEGSFAWAGDGSGHASLMLRGSFGPVAARGTVALLAAGTAGLAPAPWGAAPSALGVWSDDAAGVSPTTAALAWALLGDASYRIDRSSLLQLDALYQPGHALAQRLTYRRLAVAPQVDAALTLELGRTPAGGLAAVGLTGHHVPRREPASSASIWLGVDDIGRVALSPAFTLRRAWGAGILEIQALAPGIGFDAVTARVGVQWAGSVGEESGGLATRISVGAGWRADSGLYVSLSFTPQRTR